jgi:hypothetical protein
MIDSLKVIKILRFKILFFIIVSSMKEIFFNLSISCIS